MDTRMKITTKVARRTLVCNVLLTIFKMIAGVVAGSAGLVADAVHSLSDLVGDVVVLVGVRMAHPQPDEDHPYGHEKIECIAGILMAGILFAVGVLIGWSGLQAILRGSYQDLAVPGMLALVAAAVSIGVKEALYWYIRGAAKSTGSVALLASAWHSRSDALSSVGSFVGILGARLGFPVLDSAAGVVISIFILKVSVDIFRSAACKITDKACDDQTVQQIRGIALDQPMVVGVDLIKTRVFGERIYVDLEISYDGNATLYQAHAAAQSVHDAIEQAFPEVKHCMVHVNPASEPTKPLAPH